MAGLVPPELMRDTSFNHHKKRLVRGLEQISTRARAGVIYQVVIRTQSPSIQDGVNIDHEDMQTRLLGKCRGSALIDIIGYYKTTRTPWQKAFVLYRFQGLFCFDILTDDILRFL